MSPTNLLIYTRQIARIAAKQEDAAAEAKAYAAVDALLKSGRIPPENILANRLEIIRQTWTDPDAPMRIEALTALWSDPSLTQSPRMCEVGDELAMYYFFHEPPLTAEFEAISSTLLNRLESQVEKSNRANFSLWDTLFVRSIMMSVEMARVRNKADNATAVVGLFENTYKDRDIEITIPTYRPVRQGEALYLIYLREFPKHVEASKQRNTQATLPTP